MNIGCKWWCCMDGTQVIRLRLIYMQYSVVAQNDTNNFSTLSQTNNWGLLITLHVTMSPYQHRTIQALSQKREISTFDKPFWYQSFHLHQVKIGLGIFIDQSCLAQLCFLSNQTYFKKESKFPFERPKFYVENFYIPT